jgi:hypothetical protein
VNDRYGLIGHLALSLGVLSTNCNAKWSLAGQVYVLFDNTKEFEK